MSTESLASNYARGGFTGHLGFGRRPALAIIDLVNAYVLEGAPLYGGEGCQAAHRGAIELLGAARQAGIAIIHTRVAYQPGGRDGGVFFRKIPALACFETGRDPRYQAFADGLEPWPGETVITKQYASAFFGTSLASTLTALGVDTLLIAGVSTSGCIRASAIDCCQHGFIPVVVREAVGDRAAAPHEANLFDLSAKYADVLDLATVQNYLGQLRG